ncbi:phospholipase A2 inhibitor and Ly6/PLAUR domain-containing protein-like [Labeo rohita]|uniref:phospholipase A2 inhibitor and Ly6/PLAUR domain-containing protein-like n=1 Tax=Labeo rohita TaxID=84645 RepID=UPI0021E27E9C|nr:phospholipase A2 inhibitor and Ly6/PLAUR domain-containing protein-like [Labeo rohita]
MHLQASVVLLLILLTGGFSLNCNNCRKGETCKKSTCSNQQSKCASSKIVEYSGQYRKLTEQRIGNSTRLKPNQAMCELVGTKVGFNSTSCAMAHECENWSISTGCWRKEYSALCCDTNNCNNRVAPDFNTYSHRSNGKRCYTCDSKDCLKIMNCWGNEDYCFSSNKTLSHQSVAKKGCASKSACERELERIAGPYGNVTCCEGNLCNGAQSVTQSFLFLCCSVLSFILLH